MDALTTSVITAGTFLNVYLLVNSAEKIAATSSRLEKCISEAACKVFDQEEDESPCLEIEKDLSNRKFEQKLHSVLTAFFTVLLTQCFRDCCR